MTEAEPIALKTPPFMALMPGAVTDIEMISLPMSVVLDVLEAASAGVKHLPARTADQANLSTTMAYIAIGLLGNKESADGYEYD